MKKYIFIILALTLSFYLGIIFKTFIDKAVNLNSTTKSSAKNTTPKKVIGVGGIFFKSNNPEKLKDWYKTYLGFNTDQFGCRFEWQEGTDSNRKASLQWSPFYDTESYFAPSTKEFMINYRVENLQQLVNELNMQGVKLLDTIETYEYGKFVHLMDIDGNKIELYEPNYSYGTNKD